MWMLMVVTLSVGLSNLTSLSFKKSTALNAEGMRAFSNLFNLEKLDLERCSWIHGGFVHLKGLSCVIIPTDINKHRFLFSTL